MFFQSKPKFQESKQFLDSYIKLKKKIIQIIKNLFLKIFNKHLTDANQNLEKFSFYTLFPASSPPSSSPRPSSTSPSSLPPPSSHIPSSSLPPPPSSFPTSPSSFPSPPSSLPPAQSTDYQAYFRMLFPEYSEPNNTDYAIKINQVLRNLLVFMENSSKTDKKKMQQRIFFKKIGVKWSFKQKQMTDEGDFLRLLVCVSYFKKKSI